MRIDLSNGSLDQLVFDAQGHLRLMDSGSGHVSCGTFVSECLGLAGDGGFSCRWIEQWTAPQQYVKYPGNPIYGPDLSGPWDTWTNGVSIVHVDRGTRYRMYYCGGLGEGIGFAEAEVEDPLTWREHPASPVLLPRKDNWEGNRINQPRVVKVTDSHWFMYYTGWGNDPEHTQWAMGLAESLDGGISWRRVVDDPVIERGAAGAP
ncbi:MAG: hypothetical protein GX620_16970, partial [Chloroflexi bacterium]|nr:hypothetical protein [Chloroflexota bacterium]